MMTHGNKTDSITKTGKMNFNHVWKTANAKGQNCTVCCTVEQHTGLHYQCSVSSSLQCKL